MDLLDKLPLPKNITYTDEERDVHDRLIEPDSTSSTSSSSGGGMMISLKSMLIIFILFLIFANSYFHTFLDTITYFNSSPIKIYITSGVLFLITSLIAITYIN
jgi:hypothetical protein